MEAARLDGDGDRGIERVGHAQRSVKRAGRLAMKAATPSWPSGPRRAAVKVASPHWVGGNVLTKPNRVLIVQVPSDRTALREPRMKPQVNEKLRLAGCVYARPTAAIRLRPGSDQEGIVPAAATAGLARRTKGTAKSAYPKTGTAGDGASGCVFAEF